jgi:hypothetical protein
MSERERRGEQTSNIGMPPPLVAPAFNFWPARAMSSGVPSPHLPPPPRETRPRAASAAGSPVLGPTRVDQAERCRLRYRDPVLGPPLPPVLGPPLPPVLGPPSPQGALSSSRRARIRRREVASAAESPVLWWPHADLAVGGRDPPR